MAQPDASIVRITDGEGNTLGTGFLVAADGRIVTCRRCDRYSSGTPRPAFKKASFYHQDPKARSQAWVSDPAEE